MVFSHRAPRRVAAACRRAPPAERGDAASLDAGGAGEWQGRVSPDGKLRRVRLRSRARRRQRRRHLGRDWTRSRRLGAAGGASIACASRARLAVRAHPAWAPDNARVAYAATRGGSIGVWVVGRRRRVERDRRRRTAAAVAPAADAALSWRRSGGPAHDRPMRPVLASRNRCGAGVVARRTDAGRRDYADVQPGYNGNPQAQRRRAADAVRDAGRATRCGACSRRGRWTRRATSIDAAGTRRRALDRGVRSGLADAEDAVLRDGDVGAAWDALRAKYRPQMAQREGSGRRRGRDRRMIAEQPLIKPAVESSRAVVASGHPLASAAGRAGPRAEAATSSTPASPWRSRSASSSPTRRASAATGRRFCSSRA